MFLDWCGSVLVRPVRGAGDKSMAAGTDIPGCASAPPAGFGAPGSWVEMPGLADAAAAFCLDLVVPGDVQPVARSAAGVELPGFDPVVDDAGAAAELAGGFGDADLAVVFSGRGTRGCGGSVRGRGGPAQVGGLGNPGAAAGPRPGRPGGAGTVSLGRGGRGRAAGVNPVVDDAGAAAQLPGGV